MDNFNKWCEEHPNFKNIGMIDSDGGTNCFEVFFDYEKEVLCFWYHEEPDEPVSVEFVRSLMSTEHWQEQMLYLLADYFNE
jgi:hypothetical protein